MIPVPLITGRKYGCSASCQPAGNFIGDLICRWNRNVLGRSTDLFSQVIEKCPDAIDNDIVVDRLDHFLQLGAFQQLINRWQVSKDIGHTLLVSGWVDSTKIRRGPGRPAVAI